MVFLSNVEECLLGTLSLEVLTEDEVRRVEGHDGDSQERVVEAVIEQIELVVWLDSCKHQIVSISEYLGR